MHRGPFLSASAIEALAARAEDQIARELLRVIAQVQRGVPLSALERAILARNLDQAVELTGIQPLVNALHEAEAGLAPLRETGWHQALNGLPRQVLQTSLAEMTLRTFEAERPDLVAALRRVTLDRVTAMAEETRQAVRDAIQIATLRGVPPANTARQIRDMVGLTRRQVVAVERFRARLEAQGRDPRQVERMTTRYIRRQLTLRADSIARTETFAALDEAKRLQWERMVREGVIDANAWSRIWVTARDERVCPICKPLNNIAAPIGGEFVAESGVFVGPPAHPLCRCVTLLRLSALHRARQQGGTNPRAA